jgi:hypothetical protein
MCLAAARTLVLGGEDGIKGGREEEGKRARYENDAEKEQEQELKTH